MPIPPPPAIRLSRRALLAACAVVAAAPAPAAEPFSHDVVETLARDLAARPFQAPDRTLPRELRKLDYDHYRQIRFNEARALWGDAGLPFRMHMFPRGFLYETRVALHEVQDGIARPIAFDPGFFSAPATMPMPDGDAGFAGFRLLHPLNHPDRFDEIAAFLGASYFRALGAGHAYGISARGLAINTAAQGGEEFPYFRAFWIERPAPRAARVVVHALLDSPGTTGAYRFDIAPGPATVMDVTASLWPRVALSGVGIAPGTSMFLHAPNDRDGIDDFRPRVHDSDGLFMITGSGEEIWRPLSNPRTLQVSGFQDRGPRGFGLMQRARAFAAYQDLEARYHARPGLWVEPGEDWGAGEVQLVEIPADREIHDNIVALWRPAQPLSAGVNARFRYRLHWTSQPPGTAPLARFTETLVGAGSERRARRFVLDAVGGRLAGALPQLELAARPTALRHVDLRRNEETGGVRVAFELLPQGAPLVELRAQLRDAQGPVSETWVYRWTA